MGEFALGPGAGGLQKASILLGGNMAQKSIASFFSKPAAKKPGGGGEKTSEENPAKTKDTGPSRSDKKKKRTISSDSEEESTKVEDEGKENSKNAANKDTKSLSEDGSKNGANTTEAAGGPVELDAEGLPPLRKTAVNPAFKRKGDDVKESPRKVVKKDDVKEEEEDVSKEVKKETKKAEVTTTKQGKGEKASKNDEKKEKSKKAEKAKAKETVKETEEDMEVDESPVKSSKKKKKAVIESDSEEDSPVKKKKESPIKSPEKKVSSPKKSPEKKVLPPKKSPEKKSTTASPKKTEQKSASSFFTPKMAKTKSKTGIIEETDKEVVKVETSAKEAKEEESVMEEVKEESIKEEVAENETKKQESKATKAAFASFFTKPKAGEKKRNEGGSDYEQKVLRSSYNPVEDSFWARGEATPYLALAKTLESIEATSGRLRTIEMLSNYFRSVTVQTPADLLPSVYMTLNRLAPAWEGVELGIGESLLMKAIAQSTGRSVAQIKEDAGRLGDLGLVAEQSRGAQRTMFQPAHLTVQSVFSKLGEIAALTGHSSGTKKVEKIQALLVACRGSEARYLIRSLAGKLRIGLAEQSVLQALAQAVVQTPVGQTYPPATHTSHKSVDSDKFKEELAKESLKLKTSYAECPTYDLLIPALLEDGIAGLSERCKLTPGIPLRPMLAHPTKGVQEVLNRFENCKFTCEWKYDGERAQIHLHKGGKVNIFSRNQEDNTTKFPDIIARLPSCLVEGVESAVLDCEAVAWDREKKSIQPFQILSTRKRKDAVEDDIKVQVCVFAFDLLYLNGESLVTKSFEERRNMLKENFKAVEGEFQFAQCQDGNTVEEIQEALEESIKDNCEGLMVKTLDIDATYEIAKRSHNWLKLKKDYLEGVGDTLDLVVLGGYMGKGKRAGKYGGFLLGCYEPENEEYQSICKIGTGFTDEDLAKHAAFFKDHVSDKPKAYYSFDPSLAPDHWFEPVQVWEVKCADLSISPVHKAATGIVDPSKGVSLRFPRFIRIRDDKKVEDATNAEQIASFYNSQDIIKNQNKDKKQTSAEDDFDF